jgi:hypothetical protein
MELVVVRVADGAAEKLTGDSQFAPNVIVAYNLFFLDDASLLFMAGISAYDLDAYLWDSASGSTVNITGYGSHTVPFDGLGDFTPRAAWVSANGAWVYWVEHRYSAGFSDIRGLNRQTRAIAKVITDAEVPASPGTMVACGTSGDVYFAAEPVVQQNNREIWNFDQNAGTAATKLTTMSTSPTAHWHVFHIALDQSCSRLAWSAGAHHYYRELWTLDPSAGPARRLTAAPRYIPSTIGFTPDVATLVFGSGGDEDALTPKAVAVGGSRPMVLDGTAAGKLAILAVY